MAASPLEKALLEIRALRQADRKRDLSADIAATLRQREWSLEDARCLRDELINEYQLHDRHREAEVILQAQVDCEPAEPFHSLRLAEHFHYYNVDLQRALGHIGEAIAKARADGKFMYQALGIRARIAIESEDWPLLEVTLRELTEYEHVPGNVDVFPESDFIQRIPPSVVPDSAITSYKERIALLRSIDYSTLHGARRPRK